MATNDVLLSNLIAYQLPQLPLATLYSPGYVSSQGGQAEQNLGALVISGTTSPSGTLVKTYQWRQVDKIVFLYWVIKYQTAGLLVQAMSTPLPADCPAPVQFQGHAANSWLYVGDGGVLTSLNQLANGGSMAGIFKELNGDLSLRCTSGSSALTAAFAFGSVSYLTV